VRLLPCTVVKQWFTIVKIYTFIGTLKNAVMSLGVPKNSCEPPTDTGIKHHSSHEAMSNLLCPPSGEYSRMAGKSLGVFMANSESLNSRRRQTADALLSYIPE
jgi:hypothetical protein